MTRQTKKRSNNFSRKPESRKAYDLVLIVTEGQKTEPNYFNGLIRHERLSSANVEVTGECGSDPMSVVNEAIKLFKKSKKGGTSTTYNRVYCVIDRDEHANFSDAIQKAKDNKLYVIKSYPCFEYWYLCHFEGNRSPMAKSGKNSSADNCIKLLHPHWQKHFGKKYTKADEQTYTQLSNLLDDAIKNARQSCKDVGRTGDPNPSTEVHDLVEYLRDIKKRPNK